MLPHPLLPAAALLATAFLSAQFPAAAPQRPAATRSDPNSPANIGRTQLTNSLDELAAKETATRRSTIAAITTRAQAEARQREVRQKILTLIGTLPEKTPLHAKSLGTTTADGFRIEKILFESQPNFPVTALLYLPETKPGAPQQKLPGIVVSPGHGFTGKATDYTFASTFARNGFAVLSYDPIGQGERLQYPDPADASKTLLKASTGEHSEAGLQPTLIGDAPARIVVWDSIRAVDYLLSRPEVDPNRIGAFGCSGGGTMTALLGAVDTRVHAIAVACYLTSFDALLPALGPQDAEQSIPNFIAGGPQGKDSLPLDFPDWVEVAAPRPYAIISTAQDMFPYAGALATATEARRFYALFDPASAGTPTHNPQPGIPTGPTLNPDTSNAVPATADLQWITGIGRHGNLGPIAGQIVSFFLTHLAHSDATPILPPRPTPGTSPFALASTLPKDALQVTPTGQVSTSYPHSETVQTLTLKRYATLPKPKPLATPQLQQAIREVTHATAIPGESHTQADGAPAFRSARAYGEFNLRSDDGTSVKTDIAVPIDQGRHPATLLLTDSLQEHSRSNMGDKDARDRMNNAGTVYLAIIPHPSPPGTEETKASILGPFYLTGLRAELVGKTLLGLRADDVIHAVDYLASRPDVDPNNITAVASGHLGLVLLHAAVLDPRLKHVTVDHTLESYASLMKAPMPIDAPEDILPGVLRRYDIPDLTKALGPRLTFNDPLPGIANLSTSATHLQ